MIDSSIEKLAQERAQQLEQLEIFVTARPGTPLELLLSEVLPGSDQGMLVAGEDFTQRITGMADELADRVRGYLDFARNVAKPALSDIESRVAATIASITVNPFNGMNIVELELPGLMSDHDFVDKLHTNNNAVQLPKVATKFTARTDAELLEMCSTGQTAWDEQFAEWVQKQGEGTLQRVWQSVFMDPTAPRSVEGIQTLDALLNDYNDGKCSALIIFLLSNRLYQNVGEDCGVDLNTARSIMFALMNMAANNCLRSIEWYNSFVSTNSLVADTNLNKKLLRVNATVFKEYQAAGHKPEALLGMLVSGKKFNSVADISANAEMLLKEWNNYTLSRTEATQAEYELNVRAAMKLAFESSLATPFGDAETDQLAQPGVRENALRIFGEELQCATREEIHRNWIDVLWRASCKARYYYFTFIYELLDSIDYSVREQGLDADSASRLATQKIVARFVNEMLVKV